MKSHISEMVYQDLAEWLMFSSNKSFEEFKRKAAEHGLELRKNRGIQDINKAIAKAKDHKRSFCKVELEINMLQAYLKSDILKEIRGNTK